MVFQLRRTFKKPAEGANVARGYPAPGDGAQTIGDFTPAPWDTGWQSDRPTQGVSSFFSAARSRGEQRGFPAPFNSGQRRPPGSMPNAVPAYGGHIDVVTPYFSRGAAATVQNFGKVLTNPIGAGVVARYRPQASYGPAAQYVNGAIWWTSQAIPTSVNLQGLTDPRTLAAVLGPVNVKAALRTTG